MSNWVTGTVEQRPSGHPMYKWFKWNVASSVEKRELKKVISRKKWVWSSLEKIRTLFMSYICALLILDFCHFLECFIVRDAEALCLGAPVSEVSAFCTISQTYLCNKRYFKSTSVAPIHYVSHCEDQLWVKQKIYTVSTTSFISTRYTWEEAYTIWMKAKNILWGPCSSYLASHSWYPK